MNGFLNELGVKLADKWLTLLVGPGLIFLTACAIGGTLQDDHWNDIQRLKAMATRFADVVTRHGAVTGALAILAAVLASAVAGLAARSLAQGVQQVWLGQWPSSQRIPARWLVTRRNQRWQQLHEEYTNLVRSADGRSQDAASIATARNRIALARPSRATWMGDRMAAVESRVYGQYAMDLVAAWPRLWLIIPDTTREELRLAHSRFSDATLVAAWGLLYLLLGAWWWPALLVGAGMILVSWSTARTGIDVLAELVEATVDVHNHDLANVLGISVQGDQVTLDAGKEITRRIRKGA